MSINVHFLGPSKACADIEHVIRGLVVVGGVLEVSTCSVCDVE